MYTNIYIEKKIERESMENAYKIEREREREIIDIAITCVP